MLQAEKCGITPFQQACTLFPLDGSGRLVRRIVPERAGPVFLETQPKFCEGVLVNFREVRRHRFGAVHRAKHDAGLSADAEREHDDGHLPNFFVQIVFAQKFRRDVVE